MPDHPGPHKGGDTIHDTCADVVPPNRFPGMDVMVAGKRFDALAANANVLWEIKTNRYDTYPQFLQRRTIEEHVEEIKEEIRIASLCGYRLVVGVSSEAHREALLRSLPNLNIRHHEVLT